MQRVETLSAGEIQDFLNPAMEEILLRHCKRGYDRSHDTGKVSLSTAISCKPLDVTKKVAFDASRTLRQVIRYELKLDNETSTRIAVMDAKVGHCSKLTAIPTTDHAAYGRHVTSVAVSPKNGVVAISHAGGKENGDHHGVIVLFKTDSESNYYNLFEYGRIFNLGGLPYGALPDGPGKDANLEVNTPFTIGYEIEFTENGNLHLPIHGENHGGGLVLHADVIADFAATGPSDY